MFNKIGLSLRSMPLCVSYYILFILASIFKQNYITGDYMLTSSDKFFEIKSSTLVSYLYGLMRRILYLISFATIFNETVPLIQHRVIKNGTVYGISYLYAVCLVSMTSSLTLLPYSTLCIFLRVLSLLFASDFSDVLTLNPPYVLLG